MKRLEGWAGPWNGPFHSHSSWNGMTNFIPAGVNWTVSFRLEGKFWFHLFPIKCKDFYIKVDIMGSLIVLFLFNVLFSTSK